MGEKGTAEQIFGNGLRIDCPTVFPLVVSIAIGLTQTSKEAMAMADYQTYLAGFDLLIEPAHVTARMLQNETEHGRLEVNSTS